jgi:hypothetical protein
VIPVLGDYLEEGEVARHDTTRVASDLVQLGSQSSLKSKARSNAKS